MTIQFLRHQALFCGAAAAALALLAAPVMAQNPLVTGKSITLPPLGTQTNVGSLPMNMIATPDGKWAVSSDMGFRESLHVLSTTTGQDAGPALVFGKDNGNGTFAPGGMYYGLAAQSNADGSSTVYVSEGAVAGPSSTTPGVATVYTGTIGVVTISPSGTPTLTRNITMKPGDFPAGIALDGQGRLYIALSESFGSSPNPGTAAINNITTPGALAIIDTVSGTELGRYSFVEPKSTLSIANATLPFSPTNFPLSVAAVADGSKVYVTSQRDNTVSVLNCSIPASPTLTATLATGQHPISLLLNKAQTKLYVANAHSETVSVVSTATSAVVNTILLEPTGAHSLPGVTPTGLGLTPDESRLYVSLGDFNAIGVVDTASNNLIGYIPAGWYPTAIVASPVKPVLLVANAKGTQTRYPNPGYQQFTFAGQYDLNLIEGTVETIRVPGASQLAADTQMTMANSKIASIAALGPNLLAGNPLAGINLNSGSPTGSIKHIFYIIKENRTYDQVLGDLPQGNGEADLALFGQSVTPNLHALASRFVLLDNFFDCAEASGDGWPWSTQGQASEYVIKNLPYNYSGRGRNYDFEGANNNYPVGGFPVLDPYGVPLVPNSPFKDKTTGIAPVIQDVSVAPGGHIWDDVRTNVNLSGTGLTTQYRNYGFFSLFGDNVNTPDNYPADLGLRPAGHDGGGVTDIDFREYDATYPDSEGPAAVGSPYPRTAYGHYAAPSRYTEWNREFQQMLAADPAGSTVPAFETVRFMHDHTQGVSTRTVGGTVLGNHLPTAEVADNDYGIGQFVQAISQSKIWNSSAIFVIEDDAQDGPDHIDCHRSTCYVISPFIKKSSVDHTFYNTDSVLKTMELLLNIPPMNQYDAIASPILDFDTVPSNTGVYMATQPAASLLSGLAPTSTSSALFPLEKLCNAMDFVHPDSAPESVLNQVIWKSVKGVHSKMPAIRHSVRLLGAPKPAVHTARKDSDD